MDHAIDMNTSVDINPLRGLEDSSLFAEFDRWFIGDMTVDRRVQHPRSFFQILLGLTAMGWLGNDVFLNQLWNNGDCAVDSLVFDDRLNCYLCGRQHTMSKSMMDVDMLLIHVNLDGAHWVLARVDFRKNKVWIYDSLLTCHDDKRYKLKFKPLEVIFPRWLEYVGFYNIRPELRSADPWKVIAVKSAPQQEPGTGDCDDAGATDCCLWERVDCSNTTGRVIKLDLAFIRNRYLGADGYLNASLFTPFQQLESLDLTDNNMVGCVENEGIERLSRLNNLKMLNLNENSFNNSILSSLTPLSSLRSLKLSYNRLEGSIDVKEFDSLRDLEELDIGGNKIDKFVVSKGLRKLRYLSLSGIKLNHSILSSLTIFSSLRELYLHDTGFKGTFDIREFDSFNNLEVLNMRYNEIDNLVVPQDFWTSEIPEHLAVGCVNLKSLVLSNNSLNGHMFSRNFNLTNLRWLQLDGNHFVGEIPQSLSKCSSLEGLYLNNNSLSNLSYNRINGIIPKWVDGLSQLSHLILGHNNLEGEVPVQLCKLNQLQLLDLSNNNLHGHIPPCFDNTKLHESYNNSSSPDEQFEIFFFIEGPQGSVKKQINEIFEFTTKNIAYIYQGKVLSLLSGLDLSCNKLIGHIPPQIGNLTRIQTLNLSHNNLTGSIPSTFSNLKHVESLDLSNNKLNGKIPHQLVELKTLVVFSVAYNNLSGEIPEWTAQFATFNESSYEGNTFLCGLPIPICISLATMPEASIGNERDDNLIDMDSFFITFTTSYVSVIFGIVIVLYANSYWRRRWFYFVEMWITSCYYFVVNNLIATRYCH
ncbi:Receptor-like protein 13 [Citrus sinensis]|uniref:Receptor-like protein 13 n=1 Tax=Citrus sinensis TaxID=2711 RepID=A0ACB8JG32_CITSI|nr:Receptor-like protein 13 [Citrus sinensis]